MYLGKFFTIGYFFMLGYLAKKYEIPQRIALTVTDAVGELAGTAGKAFAHGMMPPDLPEVPAGLMKDLFTDSKD